MLSSPPGSCCEPPRRPSAHPAYKNISAVPLGQRIYLVGRGGFGPPKSGDDRFTVCSLWPLGNLPIYGAGDWNRTHNLLITSQLLCQLSYTSKILKKWCLRAESNHRQRDFQSLALPTELPRHLRFALNSRLRAKYGDLDGDRTHDL